MLTESNISHYDDHCWLVFNGHECRIIGMKGLGNVKVITSEYLAGALDLSAVNWEVYISACERIMVDSAEELAKW